MGLGVAACTALPGDGPWMGGAQTTSTEALPFDVIDLTPTTVVAYRQPPTPDKPATTTSSLSPAQRLTVAPGDSLRVRIFERYGGNIFPTIQGQSADLGIQRVAEDGSIKIPVVGVVRVAGLDLNQIESRIIQALGNKVQEPEVIVEFDAPRTHTVMVSGDVKNPGPRVDARGRAHRRRCHQQGRRAALHGHGLGVQPDAGRGASQWSGHTDDAILRFVGR